MNFKSSLESMVKYVRVSPLLHSSSLVTSGVGIYSTIESIQNFSDGNYLSGSLYAAVSAVGYAATTIFQLDSRARFRLYERLVKIFEERGYNERVLEIMTTSRCQRGAAKYAAADVGLKDEVDNFFTEKGYRWYHLIPNKLLESPSYIFNVDFWKQSLSAKKVRKRTKRLVETQA